MWLHLQGYLHIDSEDFMKWNLWLSYFAGTQASLVLMSSSRQAHLDRQREEANNLIDKKTLEKVQQLAKHIELIEGVLEEFVEEQREDEGEDSERANHPGPGLDGGAPAEVDGASGQLHPGQRQQQANEETLQEVPGDLKKGQVDVQD